jgi:rRNA-processing protein FCF1
MKKVILDANVLIYWVKQKIDLISSLESILQEPFEIATTASVVEELKKISRTAKKSKVYAKASLELLDKMNIKVIPSSYTHADKDIMDLTDKDVIVVTNDKRLKERLKRKVRVLSVGEIKRVR